MAPPGDATRPTTDRVREALMSMLEARDAIAGACVLDLYAGSGALALEALSRGATSAICVEQAPHAQHVIRANIAALGYAARCRLRRTDVERALRVLAGEGHVFGLVFADPPYAHVDEVWTLLSRLHEQDLLAEGACVVVEHASKKEAPMALGSLELATRRCYGDCAIALYTAQGHDANTRG